MAEEAAVDLTISEDRMAVLISCDFPTDEGYEALVHALEARLHKLGLPPFPDRGALEQALREIAARGPKAENAVLLEGVKPVEGEDGYAAWTEDFFNTAFCIDPDTGNIDYRRRVAQTSVKEGQMLAKLVPPKPGKPGVNVFGEEVAPRKLQEVQIRPGKHVELREEEQALYAAISGRIRLDGNKLSVDDVLTVPESVGLRSGDITHFGAVVVRKDVEAGATLEAEGDVEVYGVVDGAKIKAGGNLIVHSGIIGHPGTFIEVGGSVHARFITECTLEAGGDVSAERQIINSVIKSRGEVSCPGGPIVGGEVTALRGVVAGETGSSGCVRTVVRAGLDFRLQDQLAALDQARKETMHKQEVVEKALAPYLLKIRKGQIPTAQRQRVIELAQADKALRAEAGEISQQMEALREESKELARFNVEVKRQIHPETVVVLDIERMHFTDQLLGPMTVKLRKNRIVLQ
jgi:uncharacterized protein